jgi:hypothetical protein
MSGTGTMALLAPDIPFRNSFRPDVVVDRMATIAERAGRPLHVVIGVEGCPPVGAGGDLICTPDLMVHVPLRAERKVIIAALRKVPLLPFAAVNKSDIVFCELHQRVGFGNIGDDRFRVDLWVAYYIGHPGLAPSAVNGWMAGLAGRRTSIARVLGKHAAPRAAGSACGSRGGEGFASEGPELTKDSGPVDVLPT